VKATRVAVAVAARTELLTVLVFLSVIVSFPFEFPEALSRFVSLFACSRPFGLPRSCGGDE